MEDVLDAFASEARELDGYLSSLDAERWMSPSLCDGWSVSDVVLHLAQTEEAVISTFEEGSAIRPFAAHVAGAADSIGGAVDGLAEAAVVAERPQDPSAVLERWRRAHARAMEHFRTADPSERLDWIAVPLSAHTLATTRLSEHWIRSMDIREPLGEPAPDTDRLRFIARLAWRTLPYAFDRNGQTAPTVALHLIGPSGDGWTFGDDDSTVTISGPAGDWCRLAARRRAPSETALTPVGQGADRVLELVRTYA